MVQKDSGKGIYEGILESKIDRKIRSKRIWKMVTYLESMLPNVSNQSSALSHRLQPSSRRLPTWLKSTVNNFLWTIATFWFVHSNLLKERFVSDGV